MAEGQSLLDAVIRRPETQAHAAAYVRALLGPVERKNNWQLAEHAGYRDPYAFQNLLGRAAWEADELRDELQRYVGEQLGWNNGILVVDETGFLKKGTQSAGVARQYSGTAGRTENSQVGVFLAYVQGEQMALIDRALYLPAAWTRDRARCARAGIPVEVEFAPKPTRARHMLAHAFASGFAPRWVVADEVYGRDGKLRRFLERQRRPYVLAIAANTYVRHDLFHHRRPDEVLRLLPPAAWQVHSCGAGSKGQRVYEWAWVPVEPLASRDGMHALLFRRPVGNTEPEETAFYLVYSPQPVSFVEVIAAAGSRWTIERCIQTAKGECGLDQYEVRSWVGWYRHMTLVMLAHTLLGRLTERARGAEATVHAAARSKKKARGPRHGRVPCQPRAPIPLTLPEVRRLLSELVWRTLPTMAFRWAWSQWRRWHQACARLCHWRARQRRFQEIQL